MDMIVWEDDNDPSFEVDMTPEGGIAEIEFNTQEEFWAWYNQGRN